MYGFASSWSKFVHGHLRVYSIHSRSQKNDLSDWVSQNPVHHHMPKHKNMAFLGSPFLAKAVFGGLLQMGHSKSVTTDHGANPSGFAHLPWIENGVPYTQSREFHSIFVWSLPIGINLRICLWTIEFPVFDNFRASHIKRLAMYPSESYLYPECGWFYVLISSSNLTSSYRKCCAFIDFTSQNLEYTVHSYIKTI